MRKFYPVSDDAATPHIKGSWKQRVVLALAEVLAFLIILILTTSQNIADGYTAAGTIALAGATLGRSGRGPDVNRHSEGSDSLSKMKT